MNKHTILKMANVVKVEGFPAFEAKLSELLAAGGDIFVMFSGSKTAAGESWCPDCVTAEPVVTACLASAESGSHFLYVGVGDRATWKDPQCIFRWAGRECNSLNFSNPTHFSLFSHPQD